ncbi:aspartyl-tRNA synthetase-like protein [Patellaria atrata CBS 101060]|uniref:aspartate--tRNA ligase n=1 Tax=Patellaria atrata CBS 101060 TaxID=1346257 RepID=A0A9P4S539_9PEZI|nr:aspartyl-tRNA synthetase-like protein [Patellaria atrata CBS 101060]
MSSLKKALHKLKPHHNSNPASDDESGTTTLASPATGSTPTLDSPQRASSPKPSPRNSHQYSRNSGTFPRPNGSDSPRGGRTSKDIIRSSGTFGHRSRNSLGSRSPIRGLREKLHIGGDDSSGSEDLPLNRDGEPMSKNQQRKHERQASREARRKEVEEKEAEFLKFRQEEEERAAREEPPEAKACYGMLPVNHYAGEWTHAERTILQGISAKDVGKELFFRARIHHLRKLSSHLVFFVFRQQTVTIQGVLHEHDNISRWMMYWAEHRNVEDVVLVKGVVQEAKSKQGEVTGATIHDVEISVHEMHVEASVTEPLPFTVAEAEITQQEVDREQDTRVKVSDRTRWQNRVLDLRTSAAQGIFRVQSGIGHLFREYLDTQGFIEIHTPKLQGGATESGASVFKIDYFGRGAFLAQSPQLAKQMSIAADFKKVYEIGAVFRAENSNTHRHLTEYTGLDLEMAIDEHYHEVLRTLDNTFKYIFAGIYKKYRNEIDAVKKQFPHEDLVWLDETPRIPFKEAVQMLNETGWTDEHGKPLPLNEDLGTRDEIQLGRVIKEKYGTDYYILDKFPTSARPFYTMPDPNDPEYTNSFDIFLRGQEILSGGQRIHDTKTLLCKMERMKVDPMSMEEYINGFQWGAPPHGGGGIGLERMLMLLLQLGDIRHGSMYPRDPKSLPARPKVTQLRHPEASTMHPPWENQDRAAAGIDFQPIEKLIANYGDASNTSWLEPRTQIWRDEYTGAAIGYVPQDGFAITVGDPLCHKSQYLKTITGYLRYVKKERNLKPLWLLVGADVEEVLATKFNWRTFSVVAEQRLNPANNPALSDQDIQRKIRHAEREGVKLHDIPLGTPVPKEVRDKVDARLKDWLANRKGKQVHLTDLHPWQDMEHRQYHYAIDSSGTVASLVVMAQLSPEHGWQVKYSLDFPGAPSGTIEMIVTHALKVVAQGGATNVTFGGGASNKFTVGHNLKGAKVKVLSKAYHAIATELKLTAKTEFREKLGAQDDPVYLCYPPHGLGPMGVKAILTFFEDD